MPEFEIQNGFVSVDNGVLDIYASPIDGIKQWYRERKSTLLLLSFVFLIYMVLAVYDIGPAREVIIILFISVGAMMFAWSLYYFDVFEGQTIQIQRQSIIEAKYRSMDRLGWSQVTIVYAEQIDGEKQIKERDIQLSFPLLGGNDRLEPAIEALQKSGIETRCNS